MRRVAAAGRRAARSWCAGAPAALGAALAAAPAMPAAAAFERAPLTAESEAMGGVLAVGADAVWGNPAGAALPESGSPVCLRAGTARPFDLSGVAESQLGLSVRPGGAAGGLGVRRFGTELYAERELRIVAAAEAVPGVRLGAAARGLSAGGAFDPIRSFALDLAFLARPDSATALGAVAEAVLGELPGDPRGDRRRTALGAARRLGRRAVLRVELQRQGGGPLAAALGFSWTPWRPLTLRAGAREDPRTLTWGFTVRRGGLSLSGSAAHAALGRTVRVGLRVRR